MDKKLFPKRIRCTRCNSLLVLSNDEQANGELTCPECQKHILYSETPSPIGKESIYCPLCRNDYLISKKTCPSCGANNTFNTAESDCKDNVVTVGDINMPFWSMVCFIVQWAIASIPAAIIIFFLVWLLWAIFGGLLLSCIY